MVSRSKDKGEAAAAKIRAELDVPAPQLEVLQCDFCELRCVMLRLCK